MIDFGKSQQQRAKLEAIARSNGVPITAGTPFYYTGHFNRMQNSLCKLTELNLEFTEAASGQKWCWPIIKLTDLGFVSRSTAFGNLTITFDECTFKKPENP